MQLMTLLVLLLVSLIAGSTRAESGGGDTSHKDACTVGCEVHCKDVEENASCIYVNDNPAVCSEETSREVCMHTCVKNCKCRSLCDHDCDQQRLSCTGSSPECADAAAQCKGHCDRRKCVYKWGELVLEPEATNQAGPQEQNVTP